MKDKLFIAFGLLFFFNCAAVNATQLSASAKSPVAVQENEVEWDKIDAMAIEEVRAGGKKTDAEIYKVLGYFHLEDGNRWERAAKYLNKAVELNPKDAWSFNTLGVIYIDTAKGNDYFNKAIVADPTYPQPYYWLGYTYCRFWRDKEAIVMLEKFLKAAQKDKKELSIGRIEVAKDLLQELKQKNGNKTLNGIRLPKGSVL
jgi:tetratricopeptide (TPR) repeat protein